MSIVDYLLGRADIDPTRISLLGVSQAGWIMPLAAVRDPDIAFMISTSGAASSVGVSDYFDRIAESGATKEEIAARTALAELRRVRLRLVLCDWREPPVAS